MKQFNDLNQLNPLLKHSRQIFNDCEQHCHPQAGLIMDWKEHMTTKTKQCKMHHHSNTYVF